MLGFFRNNFGFGGNNGLTDFKDILGFNVQAQGTRAALFFVSCVALALGFLICRALVTSKFGKVLVAVRDAEARTRFLGYRAESYKLFVFTLSACMAGVAGALYVPQVGIINPSEFSPANSIEAVIWVAVGGRGTLTGAVIGAILVNYGKTTFTSGMLAPYWLFVLGGLFILVTLLLPRGIVGTWQQWRSQQRANAERLRSTRCRRRLPQGRRSRRDGRAHHHGPALSQRRQRVVRRLPRHQQSVAAVEPGEMRAIIGPNGAGKTTMMDIVTGKTRPDNGDVFFEGSHDLTKLDETADRDARHRPQIPEADRVRDAHRRGQSAACAEERPPASRHAAMA